MGSDDMNCEEMRREVNRIKFFMSLGLSSAACFSLQVGYRWISASDMRRQCLCW